jgi:TonB-linked SusC/RagA family outer membrane protein
MKRLMLFVLCVGLAFSQTFAQATRIVTGKVTDAQGNPVVAAAVQVKGTKVGTTTGNDGTFSLNVPSDATILVVSSLNFKEQEVRIAGISNVNVSLIESVVGGLDEVVVTVPYGTIKKTAFTGSEATITSKQIEKQQVTSVTRAIEGLAPGVLTTNGGGAPGTGASIVLRGFNSINLTQNPLYVVNGVPYDGTLVGIATEDIESVTLLKDAAASALYGSRAANGVIMITTKSGKKGKTQINARVSQGFMSRGIPEYDRVSPSQYYELMWEATRNAFQYGQNLSAAQSGVLASQQLTDASHLVYNAYNVAGNQLIDPATGKINPNAQLLWNDSWEDVLFRTAGRLNANVNISGASDKSDYYLSLGYVKEEGIMKFTDYQRYNFRLNTNITPATWFKTGMNIDGSYATRNDVIGTGAFTSNPFYYSRNMGPIYPVWQRNTATGAFITDPLTGERMLDWGTPAQMGTRPYAGNSNLLGSLDLDDNSTRRINANINPYAEIKFLKDFSFRTNFGLNVLEDNSTTYQNNQFGDAQSVQGRSTKGMTASYPLRLTRYYPGAKRSAIMK